MRLFAVMLFVPTYAFNGSAVKAYALGYASGGAV